MTDRTNIERILREMAECARHLENTTPWLIWEQELASLLPTRPKLANYIRARKAEWAKRRKLHLNDAERQRLAAFLSRGAADGRGLARFLRAREVGRHGS